MTVPMKFPQVTANCNEKTRAFAQKIIDFLGYSHVVTDVINVKDSFAEYMSIQWGNDYISLSVNTLFGMRLQELFDEEEKANDS